VVILRTELIVEVLGFVAALLVALSSYRVAALTEKRRYTYFSVAFFLASLASLVLAWFAYNGISITDLIHREAASTGTMFMLTGALALNLIAYLLIFLMLERIDNWPIILVLLITTITALLTADRMLITYFWISLVFTGMIAYRFLLRYNEVKTRTTLLLAISFVFIFLAGIVSLLTELSTSYYLTAAVVRLVGYLLILGAMVSIYRVGESPSARATHRMRDLS
jgi:hypothetical protein